MHTATTSGPVLLHQPEERGRLSSIGWKNYVDEGCGQLKMWEGITLWIYQTSTRRGKMSSNYRLFYSWNRSSPRAHGAQAGMLSHYCQVYLWYTKIRHIAYVITRTPVCYIKCILLGYRCFSWRVYLDTLRKIKAWLLTRLQCSFPIWVIKYGPHQPILKCWGIVVFQVVIHNDAG